MKVTLLDEHGAELTEVSSHLGRSSGQMLVDWATRPDVLFQHYFDRSSRSVTVVLGAVTWSAVLGTRWQMGARRWFLHTFNPAPAALLGRDAPVPLGTELVVTGIPSPLAKHADAAHPAPAVMARAFDPQRVPA